MLKLIPFALACAVLPVRGASDEQKPPVLEAGDRKAAEVLYKKGKEAFGAKNFAEAARLSKESMKLDPSYPEPITLWGCVEMQNRDFPAARDLFLKTKKLAPGNVNNNFNLAEVDYAEKKWKTANVAFEAVLKQEGIKPNLEGIVRFKLMIIALKLGDPKAAESQGAVFLKEGWKRELAFSDLLGQVHPGNIGRQDFMERCRKLDDEFEGSPPFYDSLIEAYFTPAP